MSTFDYTIFGAAVCGFTMVLGGILLLYKGAIKLEAVTKDPAVSIELFQREMKLTTRVPALGLFIIGLCFVALSIYFGREVSAKAIEIEGLAENIDEEINVVLRSQWSIDSQRGRFHQVVRPQLDIFWLVVNAPGYKPHTITIASSEIEEEKVDLGTIRLEKVVDRVQASTENIVELPNNLDESLNVVGNYGIGG